MTRIYDAIIVGGGHNGLVTAALLAKAGRSVLVLEQRPVLGGAAATEEIFPGCQVNTGAVDAGLFRQEVVEALNLTAHGLEFLASPATVFAPQPNGQALTLWRDIERAQAEIARFSEADAEKFPAFVAAVGELTRRLDGLMMRTPPDLTDDQLGQILPWFAAGFDIQRLEPTHLTHFASILPLSVTEFLDDWFESDVLKGALGAAAVSGTMQGPVAPWTAFTFLYHYLGMESTGFKSSRFVQGGLGQLMTALARSAESHGAEIRTGATVQRIRLDDNRATGVILAEGETIAARVVVSNADPRRTFFDLVGAPNLPLSFVRAVKNIRFKGCTAKVNLALAGLPEFNGFAGDPQRLSGHIVINPGLEYLERAFDDAKYSRYSRKPYLDLVIPTILDPALAPAGQHLMSITMQYAPYHLREGDWTQLREPLGDMIIETLSAYSPDLKDRILARQVLTPLDLETRFGLPEGSIYHGQITPDQMFFMRPVAGWSRYRTPIAGLYLCGAGTHPGGGLTGAPGFNAAREILSDLEQGG